MRRRIWIFAFFGDPTIPAGIPFAGGFNQTLKEYIILLASCGHHISIIADKSDYRKTEYEKLSEHIDIYRVEITHEEHRNQELLRGSLERVVQSILEIWNHDINAIAAIHSFYWFSGILANYFRDKYGLPFFHTPISLSQNKANAGCHPNCKLQVEQEPIFLKNAEWVLAITDQEASILKTSYHVSPSNIIITGRSVNDVFRNPIRDNWGNPREISLKPAAKINKAADWWALGAYVYLGRLVEIKGITQILQAWLILKRKYTTQTPPLWIIGGTAQQVDSFRNSLFSIIEENELESYETERSIVWWGYLDSRAISTVFLKALVLITHSRFEAGGRVVLEAMSQGIPVIATPYGFAADYINNYENGFLVPFGDIDQLVSYMELFILQPYLTNTMGNVARHVFNRIEERWNYTEIHNRLYLHYIDNVPFHSKEKLYAKEIISRSLREEVTCFPYFINKLSSDSVKDILASLVPESSELSVIEETDSSFGAFHFRGESKNRYRIKQFYNRINSIALLNRDENKKVITAQELCSLAVYSQNFPQFMSIDLFSISDAYYVTTEETIVCPSLISIYKMLDTLILESDSTLLKEYDRRNYGKDIEDYIAILKVFSKKIGFVLCPDYERMLQIIEKKIASTKHLSVFGLNYGKSVNGHIVEKGRNLLFLPTADWYWGEVGLDYIDAMYYTGEMHYPNNNKISTERLKLWHVVYIWKKLILTKHFTHIPPSLNTVLEKDMQILLSQLMQ